MAEDKTVNDTAAFEDVYPHSDPQSIKYRVVGAIIILVTCSLAWWLLLDHDVKRYESVDSAITQPVNVERFEVPQEVIDKHHEYREQSTLTDTQKKSVEVAKPSTQPKQETKAAAKQSSKVVAKSTAPKPAVQKTQTNKTPSKLPEAWLLQLGSFTDKSNAETLRQRLYRSDIPAYIKTFNVEGRKIYRVLVGPKLDRKSVEAMEARVRKKSGLQPLIVKFKPGFEE